MYDVVRYILLGLLFVGLFGLWFWSRQQAARTGSPGNTLNAKFKIMQKRWLDKGTGIVLVEAEDKTFLLAYTVGGGVSWQPVDKVAQEPEEAAENPGVNRIFPEAGRQ